MRREVVAVVAMVAILVGAGAGFGYEYVTLSGKVSDLNQTVSDLNQTVSSQEQQISSLNSMVPNSEIFGVVYSMTLFSHVTGGLNTSAYYTIWDIGLSYHSGQQVTLYVDATQLFNFTGLMNITYIGSRTGEFSVSSISPSLPLTAYSGAMYFVNRSILTVVLNTTSDSYRGFLQMYIQAYSVQQTGLPVP